MRALIPALAAVLALATLNLAGCANQPPPRPEYPAISYSAMGPLTFEAGRYEAVNEAQPPASQQQVADQSPLPPAQAVLRWGHERLKITGQGERELRFVVAEASILEADLGRTGGVRGFFTTDQVSRYDGVIAARVEIRGARGFKEGEATARVQRSRTVPENASLNDRERILFRLVEEMMVDLNAELEKNIRGYMPVHLR